ncbi:MULTISPECIES: hypothetical protein [unclassified Streptomyces]|uniref:hypothetical protein n=1 Tax=unclassified Streptomyces TaxID=2593676 RepID=UPI0036F80236
MTSTSCSAPTDLKDLGRLPALTLLYMKDLESLSALRDCSGLRELTLRSLSDCPLVEDIPVERLSSLTVAGPRWAALKDITLFTALPHPAGLDLRHCRSLGDIRRLLDMPALTHVHLAERIATSPSGAPDPVVTELGARGVTVTLHH